MSLVNVKYIFLMRLWAVFQMFYNILWNVHTTIKDLVQSFKRAILHFRVKVSKKRKEHTCRLIVLILFNQHAMIAITHGDEPSSE